jgi:hypothetical protein
MSSCAALGSVTIIELLGLGLGSLDDGSLGGDKALGRYSLDSGLLCISADLAMA